MKRADPGRSTWPAADHGCHLVIVPPSKLLSWASVFPRPCTLLIYLRETNCIFTAVSCTFICDLRNVKRECRDPLAPVSVQALL